MILKIDYKLDNWNDTIAHCRGNKFGANHTKQKEMEIVKMFLIGKPKITKYPIQLNCTWYVKNIGSDLDNKSLKAVLDAMQQVGILENDNINHIPIINHKAVKSDKDYLEIEIKELK